MWQKKFIENKKKAVVILKFEFANFVWLEDRYEFCNK